MLEPYRILTVQPEWVLEKEALGSKEKFWCRWPEGKVSWLFKYCQPHTGQHWAEKIASEIAEVLGILHAHVDLAVFNGERGSLSESFARRGRSLFHGNQILAGKVIGYNPDRRFRQSDHTLANILRALEGGFATPESARKSKEQLAGYLVLDALIGNTDRHHENWGILLKMTSAGWEGIVAPTFDHASSLGRELLDEGPGKRRQTLLHSKSVGSYLEKARGAIFWDDGDAHGLSPLELVRRACRESLQLFSPTLHRLERIDRSSIESIVNRVPDDWMTAMARQFAIELMCYSLRELREIKL
ncbi:MAG: HipA domain-containing protein [Terriglobia bacterium]